MYEQLYEYLNSYLNDLIFGFFIPACFVYINSIIEKRARQFKFGGSKFLDHSNAYDCLPHDLLIAKLETHGLDKPSLNG